jgi:hypothetical protein
MRLLKLRLLLLLLMLWMGMVYMMRVWMMEGWMLRNVLGVVLSGTRLGIQLWIVSYRTRILLLGVRVVWFMVIGVLGIHCDKKCADRQTREVDRDFKTSPKMGSATRNLTHKEGRAARIKEKREEGDWRRVQEASSAVRNRASC